MESGSEYGKRAIGVVAITAQYRVLVFLIPGGDNKMFNMILIGIGVLVTIAGAYFTIGLGIRIVNKHLFISKTMADIILLGLILLFMIADIFLWSIIYRIYCASGG